MFFRLLSRYGWEEVTFIVYRFHPLSLRSLSHLLRQDVFGETKRWQRYMANILTVLAKGHRVNDRFGGFGEQLDEIYHSPFAAEMTAQDIVQNVYKRLTEG